MQGLIQASLMAVLLYGCAKEWRADQPVTPLTYQVPDYRAEQSVGNLRRLAILPVRVRHMGPFAVIMHSEEMDAAFVYEAASYLSKKKGYEVVPVVDHDGVWRPEVLFTRDFGSLEDLEEAWERARTEEEMEGVAGILGRALNVDGVVSIWVEEYGYGSESVVQSVFWSIANLVLLNVPLFFFLHNNAEAVIYEVLSGRAIWRNRLSGDVEHLLPVHVTPRFFENLENAIPTQLTE